MGTPAVELRHVVKEFVEHGSRTLVRAVDDVSLRIDEGEFFALLGPSGCGKTTTLRAIAGFEEPSSGEVLLRGASVRGVPPFHRPVNTVFQDYALFPHMTVMQNVLFGLRMAGVAPDEARARADDALAMVRLPRAAGRRPQELSGGQKQRVALARALVNRPAVLLLDEPLGALDLKLRRAMQLELKQLQRQLGITFIYVTHDQEEALTMADRIAVMSDGKVLQVGTPDDIYERPSSRFVADFIGETNFVPGVLEASDGRRGALRLADGRVLEAVLRDAGLALGAPVSMAIRPEKLAVRPAGAPAARGVGAGVGAGGGYDVGAGVGAGLRGSVGADVGAGGDAVSGAEVRSGETILAGTVEEAHYLGTDTRYAVRVAEDLVLVARIQNQHSGFDEVLPAGTAVQVSWRGDHASILS